jgi:hypothetical protein
MKTEPDVSLTVTLLDTWTGEVREYRSDAIPEWDFAAWCGTGDTQRREAFRRYQAPWRPCSQTVRFLIVGYSPVPEDRPVCMQSLLELNAGYPVELLREHLPRWCPETVPGWRFTRIQPTEVANLLDRSALLAAAAERMDARLRGLYADELAAEKAAARPFKTVRDASLAVVSDGGESMLCLRYRVVKDGKTYRLGLRIPREADTGLMGKLLTSFGRSLTCSHEIDTGLRPPAPAEPAAADAGEERYTPGPALQMPAPAEPEYW